jgi:hypothetical protein
MSRPVVVPSGPAPPFRPLPAKPSTIRRWKIRNKITNGRAPRMEDAWMSDAR